MIQSGETLIDINDKESRFNKENLPNHQDPFSEWNYRILKTFFNKSSQKEEIFLRIDKEFLDQIGQDIGGDKGFRNAVRKGPTWSGFELNFVKSAIKTQRLRKTGSNFYKNPAKLDIGYFGRNAPAYLPYLAALIRNAAEINKGYYSSIINDFGLHENFGSEDMTSLEPIWKDLEAWTKECNGDFGYFKFRRLGGYDRIGVPFSQRIVKSLDIERLPIAFAHAQISPGRNLTAEDINRIISREKNNHLFLRGFLKALNNIDFLEPVRDIIRSVYEDWDGSLPVNPSVNQTISQSTSEANLSFALIVESKRPLSFSPCWKVPAFKDHGHFKLSKNQRTWKGQFVGSESVCVQNNERSSEAIWSIAESNSSNKTAFNLSYSDSEDSEPLDIEINFPSHLLWILTPYRNPFDGHFELVEGPLPSTGVAYLLAPPNNASTLKHYIEQQRSGEIMEADGIPNDWLLARLRDCSSLTEAQRLLPDGRSHAHPKPHPLRFTGGRSIRRGYRRMFLPYDLPTIELDAPDGTEITCSGDIVIKLSKQDLPLDRDNDFKSRKRFNVKLPNWNSALYELQAIDKSGKLLGAARLRIAGLDRDAIELEDFSLDQLGRPQSSLDGLSGSYLPDDCQIRDLTSCETLSINAHELGTTIEYSEANASLHQKFLDRLAELNSLSLGDARDFLNRKIQESNLKLEPVFVLLELRRLGHLELSTSSKGHITRIHAVKPRLYKLPLVHAGKEIYGVSGTLTLERWKALAANDRSFKAYSSQSSPDMMPSWRLLISDIKKTKKQFWQFELVETSALAVANWSAGFQSVKEQIEHNTMESIGSAAETSLKFNASLGVFRNECNIEAWQLWKIQDLDIRMDQLYILANKNSSSHSSEYAFVRDASWAKWIATSEFVRWFANKYSIEDLKSVPINYNRANGTFWVPARIGLPVILERALVMCNGTSPEVITLQRSEQASTASRISLSRFTDQSPLLLANPFYTDMAEGKWLAFHNVPEQVAQVVANKLGAVLDIF